jgi:uncharacterized protein YecA (UPF0149 family)
LLHNPGAQRINGLRQNGKIHRLDEIEVCAKIERLQLILLMPSGRHDDQPVLANLMQILQNAEAVFAGQANINQHNVYRIAMQLPPERFRAVYAPCAEAAKAQEGQQFIKEIGAIFDDGDA